MIATALTVLNKSDVLPFQIEGKVSNEDLRLEYRYLDLRAPRWRATSASATA